VATECFGERDVGGVVGAEVVAQFPHPGAVRPDGVTGDPQARVVGERLLAAVVGDLLPGGQSPDRGRDLDVEVVRGVQRARRGQALALAQPIVLFPRGQRVDDGRGPAAGRAG
jgi:hypothetical protein